MNIKIEFIQHEKQRYDTIGDWFYDEAGDLIIKVSNDSQEFPSEDEQLLVAFHELVEVLLCRKRGITQEMVDKFDMDPAVTNWLKPDEEPGDIPGAPYGKEHRFAMLMEHLLAHEMGLAGYGVVR